MDKLPFEGCLLGLGFRGHGRGTRAQRCGFGWRMRGGGWQVEGAAFRD